MVLHEENQQTNKKLGQICFQYCPRYVSSDLRGPSTSTLVLKVGLLTANYRHHMSSRPMIWHWK